MEYLDQLKLLIATYGKAETAHKLGLHIITLRRKMKNPGTFKLSEVEKIKELSEDARLLPIK